jgi:methionyl-tRNA formyltransferase
MRLVFFGMNGLLSLAPLESLLEQGVDVSAVVIPAGRKTTLPLPRRIEPPRPIPSDLPMLPSYHHPSIVHLAWERHIPVWQVGPLAEPQTLALLVAFRADLLVAACFSYIFPPALLKLPRHGCLNLHPSLLPAYRGPLPLFWMAHQGERWAGVTLHFMDEGVDTGDIVTQAAFGWPEGLSLAHLEQRCALEGGQLLGEAVQQLDEEGRLPRRPQPEEGRSYFSWPSMEDFYVSTDWEARRAFNFLRLEADWPLMIEVKRGGEGTRERRVEREIFPVRGAISYDPAQVLGRDYLIQADELWVQFNPGVLRVKI